MNQREQLRRMKRALISIRARAKGHPAFDVELYDRRDLSALEDVGGDVFDWTVTAIEADDALEAIR